MSAREAVLGRLRSALDTSEADAQSRAKAAAARIRRAAQAGPIPKIARADGMARIDQFVEKAQAAEAAVQRIAHVHELPTALAQELRRRNAPAAIRIGDDPLLTALDWGGLEVSVGPGRIDEPATLTVAAAGVAETGSLVFRSGPASPSSLNFLGETHFAVLRARDVQAGFEGVWRQLRASGAVPRTVNLITGPSRTADIEQKLELGAHGPVSVFIFLIDDF